VTDDAGAIAPEQAEEAAGSPTARASRNRSPLVGGLTLLSYAVIPIAAAFGWGTVFLIAVLVSQGADVAVLTDQYVRAGLARGQLGMATRTLIRELSAVALVLAVANPHSRTARAEALLLLGITGSRLLYTLVMVPIRRRINLPVVTRNIDLSGLRLPVPPPAWMTSRLSERLHATSCVALVGAAIGVIVPSGIVVYVIVGAVLFAQLLGFAILAQRFVAMRRTYSRDRLLRAVHQRVLALRPEVALYHSGEADSAYQVNMWLSSVDNLRRTALVILRERTCFTELGDTRSPVICIPGAVDFMTFPLPDVRVAMYTANVGKTIHLLREPGIRHVFIGHGDSDKSASSNPFSKVYTEIWVAGDAGRDRYRRADVGIRDEDIVSVGRPQLQGIQIRRGVPSGDLTVLYAPTWEGWVNDPAHTSLMRSGSVLVDRLLSLPGIRVVYKPHPFTGTVSRAAAKADAAIRASIAKSSGLRHEVIEDRPLFDVFNDADVLIADISSVLSDFIQSQKPYIVANLTDLDDVAFRDQFPSAAAAYLLDPTALQVGAVLDLIRGDDPLAERRRELKNYLLGPDEPDAATRFETAVDVAYERAVAACPVRPTMTVSTV